LSILRAMSFSFSSAIFFLRSNYDRTIKNTQLNYKYLAIKWLDKF
jgi:hypothetical protein